MRLIVQLEQMSLVVNKHDVKASFMQNGKVLLCADKSSKKELKSLQTCLDESGMMLSIQTNVLCNS